MATHRCKYCQEIVLGDEECWCKGALGAPVVEAAIKWFHTDGGGYDSLQACQALVSAIHTYLDKLDGPPFQLHCSECKKSWMQKPYTPVYCPHCQNFGTGVSVIGG